MGGRGAASDRETAHRPFPILENEPNAVGVRLTQSPLSPGGGR